MVAASLTGRVGLVATVAGAVLAAAFLVALAVTGSAPQPVNFVRFEPAGVMARPPEEISRIDLQSDVRSLIFTRSGAGRWQAGDAELPEAAAEHLVRALRFLHVSKPVAMLEGNELDAAALAEMGLAPARLKVRLFAGDEPALAIALGGPNPTETAQYARLQEEDGLLLLPLHVGREWQLLTSAVPDHAASSPTASSRSP